MARFGGVAKLVVAIGGAPPPPPVTSKTSKRRFSSAAPAAATTKSDASKASSHLFVSAPTTSSKVGISSQIPISTAKAYSAAADKKHKTNKRPAESGITKTEDYKKKLRSSSSGGTKE